MSTNTKALFDRYHTTWAARDPDGIAALHTPDSVFHLHSGQEPALGRAAIREAAIGIFRQVPDLAFEPVSLRVGDDYWVAEMTLTGTGPGGAPMRVDLVDVVSVEGGLVRSKDSYLDAVAMQTALEAAPAT